MICPKCNSEDCRRLEVIYEDGTQNINTTSRSIGAGASRSGVGGGAAHTATSGTSRTTLAEKAAPPAMKTNPLAAGLVIIGILMLFGSAIFKLIGIALIGYGIYLFKQLSDYNKTVYPEKYQYWLNQWMCHKCGNIYHQEL